MALKKWILAKYAIYILILVIVFCVVRQLYPLLSNNSIHETYLEDVLKKHMTVEWSPNKWTIPFANNYIKRYDETGMDNNVYTICFWIDIPHIASFWRNVLHVGMSYKMKYNDSGNPNNLEYDSAEDFYRRPAIFINPGTRGLSIASDTHRTTNYYYQMPPDYWSPVPITYHMALVYNKDNLTIYRNGKYLDRMQFDSPILAADKEALIFISGKVYGTGYYQMKDFRIYDIALSASDVLNIYTETNSNQKPPKIPNYPDTCKQSETVPCETEMSGNSCKLIMRDGNLILQNGLEVKDFLRGSGNVVWSSGSLSSGPLPYKYFVNEDGQVVVQDGKQGIVWTSPPINKGEPPFKLIIDESDSSKCKLTILDKNDDKITTSDKWK